MVEVTLALCAVVKDQKERDECRKYVHTDRVCESCAALASTKKAPLTLVTRLFSSRVSACIAQPSVSVICRRDRARVS